MRSSTPALKSILKTSGTVRLQSKLIAEWNYNRYSVVSSVDNNPTLGTVKTDYTTLFPILSIVDVNRPGAGIMKAITGESNVTPSFLDIPSGPRSYPVSENDPYKYWISPFQSDTAINVNSGYNFTAGNCTPTVTYASALQTNKLVVKVENSVVGIAEYAIDVSVDGVVWSQAASNPTIDAQGKISLYLQANGTWGAAPAYAGNYYALRGIRLRVISVNKPAAYAAVIEISPRREDDISAYMVDWNARYEQSNISFIAPLGQLSSNSGSITLSNDTMIFDPGNPSSPYFGILDKNIKLTVSSGIDTSVAQDNSLIEWITEFTMYSTLWAGANTPTATVTVSDSSEELKLVDPPEVMFRGLTAGQIIWRLLDIVGFSNYTYNVIDDDASSVIPYYWTTPGTSLWDEFNKICEGTQLVLYFDCYDTLQIKSRAAEFNYARGIDWTLRGEAGAGEMANIISWSQQQTFEANDVSVQYSVTDVSKFNNGFPAMEAVWTPPTDTTLRSSQATQPITSGSTFICISPTEAEFWPYDSLVNIDGEMIRYAGKEYSYMNTSNVLTNEIITSLDRKNTIDSSLSGVNLSWQNAFSGRLKITARAQEGSVAANHNSLVDMNNYTYSVIHDGVSGPISHPSYLVKKFPSYINITTNSSFTNNSMFVMTANDFTSVVGNARYGARVRFVDGVGPVDQGQVAIYFNGNTSTYTGYFAGLYCSAAVDAQKSATFNETPIFTRSSTNRKAMLNAGGRGFIPKGVWVDLEASLFHNPDGTVTITTTVNGNVFAAYTVPSAGRLSDTGQWGIAVSDYTSVDVELIYAVATDTPNSMKSNFIDKVTGDWVSGYADNEFMYLSVPTKHMAGNTMKAKPYSGYLISYYDDFGSWVHEIREFNIKFDKSPVIHSKPYISNDNQIKCVWYNSSPFGAKFAFANTARVNALVSGTDTATFIGNSVDQKSFIYGRVISPAAVADTVRSLDPAGVRRRGTIQTTFTSPWIQTKAAAQSLSNWVVNHWAGGQDEVDVVTFGTLLVQVGDLVTVDWPSRNLTAGNNKWFVVKIQSAFKNGVDETVTLRRANIGARVAVSP